MKFIFIGFCFYYLILTPFCKILEVIIKLHKKYKIIKLYKILYFVIIIPLTYLIKIIIKKMAIPGSDRDVPYYLYFW